MAEERNDAQPQSDEGVVHPGEPAGEPEMAERGQLSGGGGGEADSSEALGAPETADTGADDPELPGEGESPAGEPATGESDAEWQARMAESLAADEPRKALARAELFAELEAALVRHGVRPELAAYARAQMVDSAAPEFLAWMVGRVLNPTEAELQARVARRAVEAGLRRAGVGRLAEAAAALFMAEHAVEVGDYGPMVGDVPLAAALSVWMAERPELAAGAAGPLAARIRELGNPKVLH